LQPADWAATMQVSCRDWNWDWVWDWEWEWHEDREYGTPL